MQLLSTHLPHQGSSISTGAKAGIGVGAAIGGVLVFIVIAYFFYRQGRRSATKKETGSSGIIQKAELSGAPLSKEEKEELERRRRATELQGATVIAPAELDAQGRERWELETMRKEALKYSELE